MKLKNMLSTMDSRVMVLIIIILCIVLINLLMDIFLEPYSPDSRIAGIDYPQNSPYGTDAKIIACLIAKEPSLECRTIFSSPEFPQECHRISQAKLKDRCFYYGAVGNANAQYCESISDETMRISCAYEIQATD